MQIFLILCMSLGFPFHPRQAQDTPAALCEELHGLVTGGMVGTLASRTQSIG